MTIVFDAHAHAVGFIPRPFGAAYRFVNRTTMPPDVSLGAMHDGGVDAVVVKAVGDPVVTRWYRGSAWAAVLTQLEQIRLQAERAGAAVVTDRSQLVAAKEDGRLAVVLGLEGADAVGESLHRVTELSDMGVRVVGPVHLSDNRFGSTCLPWQKYVGPLPVGRGDKGLSPLGAALLDALDDAGIIVDGAHADTETLVAMAARHGGERLTVSTHSGVRACCDFARYLSDDEIRAIAGTGGTVGLWPYRHRGKGAVSVEDLAAQARHVVELVGISHLAIGTDANGVPGIVEGYRAERGPATIGEALIDAGLSDADVDQVLGANFLRVFDAVTRCG